jgi:aarF domain-containing kinase
VCSDADVAMVSVGRWALPVSSERIADLDAWIRGVRPVLIARDVLGGLHASTPPHWGGPRLPAHHSACTRLHAPAAMAASRPPAAQSTAGFSQGLHDLLSSSASDDDSSGSDFEAYMAAVRGSKLNEDDFAADGQVVQFMSVTGNLNEADAQLPFVYDPEAIYDFWSIRPVSVVKRILQLGFISSNFIGGILWDTLTGQFKKNEVQRAIQIRDIVTSLGPAYIKLGQTLSIRPDLLSRAAMRELQQLCDKVPSFDSRLAMEVVREELGMPWQEAFAELSAEPIAAASLGQVYRGKLHTGAPPPQCSARGFVWSGCPVISAACSSHQHQMARCEHQRVYTPPRHSAPARVQARRSR